MFTLFGRKIREAETKIADFITKFSGSMFFVYIHVVWFIAWLIFAHKIGDPFPYGLLTLAVSLEAIFLSTFILVNQNRQMEIAEERAEEEDQEEEEAREDLEEELEDIQEDFDSLHADLETMRSLIERLETHVTQRGNVPLNFPTKKKKSGQ